LCSDTELKKKKELKKGLFRIISCGVLQNYSIIVLQKKLID